MTTAAVMDTTHRAPEPLARAARPPRPPHGMRATLLDEFETGSELIVTIESGDVMTIELRSAALELAGSGAASVRRFADGSWFALGEIPVSGQDRIASRRARGRATIGIAWEPSRSDRSSELGGSALLEGDWTGGLFHFTKVDSHDLGHRLSWFAPWRPASHGALRGMTDASWGETCRDLHRLAATVGRRR